MLHDLRYAIRMLGKTPLLTGIAIAVLALGLGANTAVFSYVNALFLRPLPLPEPHELVRMYGAWDNDRHFDTFSYPNYADLRDRGTSLEGLAAHQQITVSLGIGPIAEDVHGEIVTGNYFNVLGVSAQLGRMLVPGDDPGPQAVVVLSDGLWRTRLGSQPDVVGTVLRINGHPFTVVGVAPPAFGGTYAAMASQIWVPMSTHELSRPRGVPLTRRGWGWLHGTGRLKEGVSIENARLEADRIAAQLAGEYPEANTGFGVELFPAAALPEQYQQGSAWFFAFFFVVVGIVIVITCTNLSGVFLARVLARRREIAVRQSLGASRVALMRQWVVESMALAVAGGVAGVLLALWAKDTILTLAPPDWSNFAPDLALDPTVLGFAALSAALTGLLFGIVPSLRASGFEVSSILKDESGGNVAPRSRLFGTSVLVQVTLSLVLLIVAGVFLRSVMAADSFDPGFDSDRLAVASVDLQRQGYPEATAREFYRRTLAGLRSRPEIENATYSLVVPLGTSRESMQFRFPGYVGADGSQNVVLAFNIVGPDYFRTLGIPVLHGRGFEERDAEPGATPVAVLNETAAKRFFPAGDAVGRSFQVTGGPALEVIGVARDIKYYSLGEPPMPYVYGSSGQFHFPFATFQVRVAGEPAVALSALREEVAAADPSVAATEVVTLRDLRRVPLFPQIVLSRFATVFGLLAMTLTALGLYGVVSYTVGRRTRELGVRIALGASRVDILRAVLGGTLRLAAIGLLLGLTVALVAARLLSGHLFGVTPMDPGLAVLMTAVMGLVAGLAGYLPARRATRLDPMAALRYE